MALPNISTLIRRKPAATDRFDRAAYDAYIGYAVLMPDGTVAQAVYIVDDAWEGYSLGVTVDGRNWQFVTDLTTLTRLAECTAPEAGAAVFVPGWSKRGRVVSADSVSAVIRFKKFSGRVSAQRFVFAALWTANEAARGN